MAQWLHEDATKAVCDILRGACHDVYFVGGCVRNAIIGVPVSDVDIATDARPDTVIALSKAAGLKAIPTGIDHGTVTVVAQHRSFEVTTYRRDVQTDGRRAVVAFAETMIDDAHRRDFTMNALYADPDGAVVDPLGQGITDLQAQRVRFIDDPHMRIKEDYLRILRFFRFHAWYGDHAQGIDADGLAACAAHVEGIKKLSRERIGQEMIKLLAAPDPVTAIAAFAATGGLMQVLPAADTSILGPLVHLEKYAGLASDPILRLAGIGGQDPVAALRLSKAQGRLLDSLRTETSPQVAAYRYGAVTGRQVLTLQNAHAGHAITAESVSAIDHAASQKLPVKAQDFMPEAQGPQVGAALKRAEERWIASDFTLTKEELLR